MNIGIIGLGLIGGSLGLDLRRLGHRVLGVSRRQQTCLVAKEMGAVDDASIDMTLMALAEVVFVCTPVEAIAPTVVELAALLSPNVIITDVGSVKMPVVDAVAHLWTNFVPGHPMAGTAEAGIAAAIPDLFVRRPYVLTPTATTPPEAVATVAQLAQSLQADIYYCGPLMHDRAVAWISHLPVLVSASLLAAVTSEADLEVLALAKQLASSGFRDTSRVGGGNPELGLMMAKYNRPQLLAALHAYRLQVDRAISLLETEDWKTLEQHLQQTQQARPQFLPPPPQN
ncbi:MAG TPA: prephenate/arogenate dehydrogenase [Oscillatoriaceae cyanobacterium M33_DOE_052]|uniref:Prephenate/arogenate dehydrogenase n=1 Tax=Planktothricoides sp. SpSt-374 TaxID=2282167 RepID=A0A7C3VJN1_9CYAN|nr:prephenate/arogenate dehydrogenase [Oscillatoriaceae cyanobacterium M33_DOE_052]